MPRDVFISHSAQDRKVSETICGALEQEGVQCWVAPRDVRPGKPFPGEITRAMQQCKVMLLIFSRHSNVSEQVMREVQLAADSHLPIVRLRIEDVPLSDDLRYYLSTPHWLDALTHPLSKHIPGVVAAIKELLGPGAEEAPVATSDQAPSREAKDASHAEKKSAGSRVPYAIAWAAVVVAVLGFTLWTRSQKKSEPAVASTAVTTPSPTIAASPTAASPTATAELSPTPTPVSVTPVPTPAPTAPPQTNSKGPLPRKNRSWEAWIDEFSRNFIASNETNDLDLAVSFYGPMVDLFEEGKKSTDAIREDIESYNARWPSRRATIRGDVRLSEKSPNRQYTATFEHDYYVENAIRGEWINGAVVVDLQITIDDGGVPRIVSMKQKTLRRDKGTMQKRSG